MEHIDLIMEQIKNFEANSEDIQGTGLLSIQGLPICSSLGEDDSKKSIVAAMSAAILSVSERASQELARGNLKRILLEGEDGLIILQQCGENAILYVLVGSDRQLGLIFVMMQSLAKKITQILE
ncbi:MAG: roadblock/LC7 domain-containing protein [Promethearchaeota archaeon]